MTGFLILPVTTLAQVKFGDLSSSVNGTVSTGYSADYGNMTSSDHSWTVGGVANLSGSFYNPNFASYNLSLYLNQSRANSNFQSISDASGVNFSSNLFSGSSYPGSISYSKAFNSEGNYAVPGIANYVTHGDADAFGINWGENIPGVPSFSAGFQMGSSQYSVYGTEDNGNNTFKSLNLHSTYSPAGFNMSAIYSVGDSHSLIPQVISGEQQSQTRSDNSTYGFNLAHLLPMHGSFSAGVNRSNWNTNDFGTSLSGTIDTINASVSVHPTAKLSITGNANYSDNLAGQLLQSVISVGAVIPGLNSSEHSNSLDLMAVASYIFVPSLQTNAFVERRTQSFLGEDYGVNSYGGSTSYGHKLFGGTLNCALSLSANTSDQSSSNTLGLSSNVNYSGEIRGWQMTGAFGYAQNVQTLLITYMNSFYNYSATARKRWGRFSVSAGGGAARTALTNQTGTSNSSQSWNSSVGYGSWLNATGSYSRSSGQALATGSGLVPVPVPTPVLPSNLVSLFGGDSYSFGLSSSPVKKLVFSAAYSKSNSNTSSDSITSLNESNQYNGLIQYQFRKLSLNSGYARLQQGFSSSGTPPQVISSYYIGVSRWFNLF